MKASRHFSLSSAKGFAEHRCEILGVGYGYETDSEKYAFDNRDREKYSIFQYTVGGEGRFRGATADSETVLTPGSAFLVNCPSATSYWLASGKHWEFHYVVFVGDVARYHVDQLIASRGHILQLQSHAPAVEWLQRLYTDANRRIGHDKFELSAKLYQFLMELYRDASQGSGAIPGVDRALRLMEREYGNASLTIDELAAAAGLSKFHFSRMFRSQTGASPNVYLTRLRMNKAADLLSFTQMPAKEISQAVGCSDYSYFCRVFRQQSGCSPGSVRRSRRPVSEKI